MAAAVAAACGRFGYDAPGSGGDGGAPSDGGGSYDGGAADAAVPDAGGLPPGCLVVTTAVDENDPGESAFPPHVGDGLSLREAIELADGTPGPGCVGFMEPMLVTWASAAPAIDDVLVLHGGGSTLRQTAGGAFGVAVNAPASQVRDLVVENFDIGVSVTGAMVTVGPRVVVRGSNVGMRVSAPGLRVTGCRAETSGGPGIALIGGSADATIELTVLHDNGGAGIDTNGIVGLTVRHVTVHGNGIGIDLRSNTTGVVVRNVIVTGNGGPGIDASGASGLDADFVDAFGNGAACSGCTLGPGSITSDPAYVDAAAGDFRLAPGSPAIDRGIDTGLDVNGSSGGLFNGAAPDLGALESP